jgi:3-phosphoglycerate kinase
MVNEAKNILVKGQNKIILANDFICAKEFADSPGLLVDIEKGLNGLMGLDIGNQSIEAFKRALNNAGTVF